MRNQVFKKLFSVLLALIMVAGLLPASVLAEGEGNADSTPAPTEAVQPTETVCLLSKHQEVGGISYADKI